jgi:hypothetical protein
MNGFNLLAYIDPATGAFVLQGIVACVLSVALFVPRFASKVVSILTAPYRFFAGQKAAPLNEKIGESENTQANENATAESDNARHAA